MTPSLQDLVADLDNLDESIRRYAAEDLGFLKDPMSVEHLARLLRDPSVAVCEAAVDALVLIGGEPAARSVLPALESDDPRERNAACEVLRGVGVDAVDPIGEILDTASDDVKLFAIDVISALPGTNRSLELSRFLSDTNPNVVTSAVIALGQLGDSGATSALIQTLGSNSWVDCAIARSLGQIGGTEAIVTLCGLLNHSEEAVVYAAAQGLGECGDLRVVADLEALAVHSNPIVVSGAAEAVALINAKTLADHPDAPIFSGDHS